MEINVVGGTVTKGTPKEMSLTFHIKDTNINAGLTGFAVAVSFEKEGQAGGGGAPGTTQSNPINSTELPNLTFDTATASNGCISVANNGATGDVVIPAYVKVGNTTYAVTEIKEWGFFQAELNSLIMPETITKIGEYAFYSAAVYPIVIPENVVEIGENAFYGSLGNKRSIYIDSQTVVDGLTNFNTMGCIVVAAYRSYVYLRKDLTPSNFLTTHVDISRETSKDTDEYICFYYHD